MSSRQALSEQKDVTRLALRLSWSDNCRNTAPPSLGRDESRSAKMPVLFLSPASHSTSRCPDHHAGNHRKL
jgi:hypothetical protein